MKHLLYLSFLCVFSVAAQEGQPSLDSIPIDELTGKVRYEYIFDAPGSKDALFNKAKLWLVDLSKNVKSFIQAEDKNEGYIIGKGSIAYLYSYYQERKKQLQLTDSIRVDNAEFTLKMFFKDGRIKFLITDIVLLYPSITSLNMSYDKIKLDEVRGLLKSEIVHKRAEGSTYLSKFQGLDKQIKLFIKKAEEKMKAKGENEF